MQTQVLDWRFPMGAVLQVYATAIFSAAASALGTTPIQPPQILAPWLPPAVVFGAATDIQRRARGIAVRGQAVKAAAAAATIQSCQRRAISRRRAATALPAALKLTAMRSRILRSPVSCTQPISL